MAASVVYTNFAGQIAVENRGGTVKEYIPDSLGSTVALAGTMSITDTWDYWPFGEVMTRTGSTPTPFTFVGVLGYFKDLLGKLFYIRARHYEPNYGRWLTVDPVWPLEQPYCYVRSRPAGRSDPSGLVGPELLGACLIGGIVTGIGSLLSGDSLPVAACKALVSCVITALLGAILEVAEGIAACIVGGIASLVSSLVSLICDQANPCDQGQVFWECTAATTVIDFFIGCFAGGSDHLKDIIVGLIIGVVGPICPDAVDVYTIRTTQ